MKYISLNHNSGPTSFKKAVINGLAPDKGLYFPQEEVKLSKGFIESIKNIDDTEICYEIIKEFIGDEIPKNKLIEVINNTCLLYTSPSPRDGLLSRMPSSA